MEILDTDGQMNCLIGNTVHIITHRYQESNAILTPQGEDNSELQVWYPPGLWVFAFGWL